MALISLKPVYLSSQVRNACSCVVLVIVIAKHTATIK